MSSNLIKHLALVNKHRFIVCKLCFKSGIYYQGMTHDLSKYSKVELLESIKYYNGKKSPITIAREVQGYSKAYVHHRNVNKHHPEYWIDEYGSNIPKIPYKYMIEMICDMIAASLTYNKDTYTNDLPLKYWLEKKDLVKMHAKSKEMITDILFLVKENGIKKTISRKTFKEYKSKYNS